MVDVPRPGTLSDPAGGDIGDAPFASPVGDFYMTNPIARASETMAECSALYAVGRGSGTEATGTDG